MTKLCNSCEYLKFCARSGIEEVGCDRYKKDTTTNEEWLKHCNTEQLAECLARYFYGWTTNSAPYDIVLHSVMEWLKQPHSEVQE